MIKFLAILTILASLLLPAANVLADDSQVFAACDQGVSNSKAANSTICQDRNAQKAAGTNPVNHVINVAATILATIAGLAAVIVIIVSGLRMITSGGNSEKVSAARGRLLTAVIGLIIIALAWSIITFATNRLIKT